MKAFILLVFLLCLFSTKLMSQQIALISGDYQIQVNTDQTVQISLLDNQNLQWITEQDLIDMSEIGTAPGPMDCFRWQVRMGGSHHVICGPAHSFIQDGNGVTTIVCGNFSTLLCAIVERSN